MGMYDLWAQEQELQGPGTRSFPLPTLSPYTIVFPFAIATRLYVVDDASLHRLFITVQCLQLDLIQPSFLLSLIY